MKIETRWACVGTNDQITLAASVCSLLHEDGVYLPFFEFPTVQFAYSGSRDINQDGYLAEVIGERAAYQINNALARIQPELILLLGLTSPQKSFLAALLPEQKLREINSLHDFMAVFPSKLSQTDPISCSPLQVVEGLLLAESSGKPLRLTEDAPSAPTRLLRQRQGIVVIENTRSIDDIAAINYANCVDADVVLLPGVDRRDIKDLARELYAWSKDRSHPAFRTLKRRISKNLGEIDFDRYEYATFFTVGIPYGLALENKIPITHVLKQIDCGVFLANSLVEETDPLVFDSALLFSPQLFASDETSQVERILTDANYTVKRILGREATVKNLSDYSTLYPFDLLHICSHGGETDGYFVTQDYLDRDGTKHTVEFYEIVGFSPSKPEMVKVYRKILFKGFDGIPWGSEKLKPMPHYIFEDMLRAIKLENNSQVRRARADYPIALSCHIQCSDSIHQGDFDSLAGISHPIVFNNSCSSSHELAANFIHAGARCYIATLWSVGNETAQKAAKVFYEEASKEKNVLRAFFRMLKSVANLRYQNVYIFWGLHLSGYHKPSHKSELRIQGALANGYFRFRGTHAASSDPYVKEFQSNAMKFLWHQMAANALRGMGPVPTDTSTLEIAEKERHALVPQDEFSRGVTEVDLEAETAQDT